MNWIDELLKHYGSRVVEEIPKKNTECPAEEDLHRLVDSSEGDSSWRDEILRHVVSCGYCAMQVIGLLRGSGQGDERIKSLNARLFPLPEEITWRTAKEIGLYRDSVREANCKLVNGICRHEFNVSEPGYYHVALDSGQVVWRRRIEDGDLSLTEAEREEALSYGMVAGVESSEAGITAFDESLWEGVLRVKLVKRISSGKLFVNIHPV